MGAGFDRRGQIPNKTSIHLRPIEIEHRHRVGDIEGDTIIGRHHKGAVQINGVRHHLFCKFTNL